MIQADSVHSTPPTNTSASNPPGGPESPQDSLYLPTDVSPEEVFQAIGRLRKEARDEIDRLIRFLDKTDDYMSRELEADDDGEQECEDEGSQCEDEGAPSGDDEPSLGSVGDQHGAGFDQARWAAGSRSDRELDGAESGIGDQDGLDEQVPFRDWQGRGMV